MRKRKKRKRKSENRTHFSFLRIQKYNHIPIHTSPRIAFLLIESSSISVVASYTSKARVCVFCCCFPLRCKFLFGTLLLVLWFPSHEQPVGMGIGFVCTPFARRECDSDRGFWSRVFQCVCPERWEDKLPYLPLRYIGGVDFTFRSRIRTHLCVAYATRSRHYQGLHSE